MVKQPSRQVVPPVERAGCPERWGGGSSAWVWRTWLPFMAQGTALSLNQRAGQSDYPGGASRHGFLEEAVSELHLEGCIGARRVGRDCVSRLGAGLAGGGSSEATGSGLHLRQRSPSSRVRPSGPRAQVAPPAPQPQPTRLHRALLPTTKPPQNCTARVGGKGPEQVLSASAPDGTPQRLVPSRLEPKSPGADFHTLLWDDLNALRQTQLKPSSTF